MQRLEVSGAVLLLYVSLGVKGLNWVALRGRPIGLVALFTLRVFVCSQLVPVLPNKARM